VIRGRGLNLVALNLQDVAANTETGAAPNEFENPAWVLKWSAGGSWYQADLYGSHNFQFGFKWGRSYNAYVYKVNQGINAIFNSGSGHQPFTVPSQVLAYNTPTTQKKLLPRYELLCAGRLDAQAPGRDVDRIRRNVAAIWFRDGITRLTSLVKQSHLQETEAPLSASAWQTNAPRAETAMDNFIESVSWIVEVLSPRKIN